MTIVEMSGVDAVDALCREWQTLSRASGAPPFLSWEWISAWQKWLSQGRTPYLICARRGDKLVGLLPLGEQEWRPLGWPTKLRLLSALGAGFGGADYLDVIALPEYAEEAAAAIFDHLARRVSFDILELDDLPAGSPSLPLLEQRFGAASNVRYRLTPRSVCPQLELDGEWSAILKRSRRADNFKRRFRQLSSRPGFEYRSVTQPAEADAAFERFLELHEARWTDHGGSDATGHEALQAFHRDVVKRLAQAGLLRIDELWVEGACRASIYGLDDGRRFCYYSSGYDAAWRNTSPGLVLIGLSIEDAVKRGVKRYDFLRGTETYKFDWANLTQETVSVLIARPSLTATLFNARRQTPLALRAAADALLPERAKESVRLWYRARKRENGIGMKTAD